MRSLYRAPRWSRRQFVGTAVGGAALLGFGLTPRSGLSQETATPAATPAATPFPEYRAGVNVLVYGDGSEFRSRARAVLDRVAGVNANSVALSIPLFQESSSASTIGPKEGFTPNRDSIRIFAEEARARNLTLMLRPFLDEGSLDIAGGEWRGSIIPDDLAAWWDSYQQTLVDYAELCEEQGIAILSLLVEMNSRQADVEQIKQLARVVREVYSGRTTICFNWNAVNLTFADDIDIIGIDQFSPLNIPEDADAATVRAAWELLVTQSEEIQRQTGKPVDWTEVGTLGSYNLPYVWSSSDPVETTDRKQAVYLGELCAGPASRLGGMYVWNMYFNEPEDLGASLDDADRTQPSFNIIGRPAEQVLSACYGSLTGG